LREIFTEPGLILEIGAGTGQHAVHFARELPHLDWQPTDQADYLPGIRLWIAKRFTESAPTPSTGHLLRTVAGHSGSGRIFRQHHSHHALAGGGGLIPGNRPVLQPGGAFCLYGPFNYGGRYTSASNAEFDAMLKQRDPASGIRDFADLDRLARITAYSFGGIIRCRSTTVLWSGCATR
jgi:hypothetical protein